MTEPSCSSIESLRHTPAWRVMISLLAGFPRHLHKQAKRVQQPHLLCTPTPDIQQRQITNQYRPTPRP